MVRKLIIAGIVLIACATLGTTGIIHLLDEGRQAIHHAATNLPDHGPGNGARSGSGHGPSSANPGDGGDPSGDHGPKKRSINGKPGVVLAAMNKLPVHPDKSLDGYDRTADFGTPWTDDNGDPMGGNHCRTRDDILERDLSNIEYDPDDPDCTVETGVLDDPYTGKVVHFERGRGTSRKVQIDHVVALGNAWQTGAQDLAHAQRVNIANDPLNLLAVDGPQNASKGADDASECLPPDKSFRCRYVAIQVAVKTKYHLWVTNAEKRAIADVLDTCPNQPMPAEPGGQG